MDQKTKDFILKYQDFDVAGLSLKLAKQKDLDKDLIVRQISGRQKVKSKIPELYSNIEILYPSKLSLEQSSSEQTAKYKSELLSGESFTDLTGGFGIDFINISRKFKHSTYIERQKELCELGKVNFPLLGLENFQLFNADSVEYLREMEKVSAIFIDPHRRSNTGRKIFKISDCEPNILELKDLLVSKSDVCMIKFSPMLDIQSAINELKNCFEIHILSVENECKELLVLLNAKENNTIQIKTVNLLKNNSRESFDFGIEEERIADCYFHSKGKYLYEPNSSIMKAGAFKSIANRYNVSKISLHTHLYLSDEFLPEFPGRCFELVEVVDYNKQLIKELNKKIPKANISTRNFPFSVEEIRKSTKIKDGGEDYIFACKNKFDLNQFYICRKVL